MYYEETLQLALRSKSLHTITYHENNLHLSLLLKNVERERQNDFSLQLTERFSGTELIFPLQETEILEDVFSKMECSIHLPEHPILFTEEAIWDLHIISKLDEDEELPTDDLPEVTEVQYKKHRLKSRYPYLELYYYIDAETQSALVPYVTNKGNVSLKIVSSEGIAKAETAALDKKGKLTVSGIAFSPFPLEQTANKQIVIKYSENEEDIIESSWQVRNELAERFGSQETGFSFDLDLMPYLKKMEESQSLRLFIRWGAGEMEDVPVKVIPYNKGFRQSLIIKTSNGKKKVSIKASKKTRTVFFRLQKYSLINNIKSKIKKTLVKVKRHRNTKKLYQVVFKFAGYLPPKKNLVMFESFLGKQYSDNPRAIYEYMLENNPEYELVWSVDWKAVKDFEAKNIPYARRFSVKWLFHMARAEYWVSNSRLPLWIPKPNHTTYLQTWHGTPLKRLAADMDEVHMPGTTTEKYKRNFHKESSKWDYLISPNAYSTEIFRRAFNFNKEVIEVGYPRNDVLYTENTEEQVTKLKDRLGIPADKKVILYAPTWRDDQFYGKGRYKFDLMLDLDALREALGDKYVIILRMHYLVAENFDLSPYEGFAFDFSYHEDIRDLYLCADLMITDYSSVFFDYANLRRPIIFFVYDIDSYRDKLRGFYFDFEQNAPGPLVKTTEEVIASIREFEDAQFAVQSDTFENFYERFCYLESGQSSHKAVQKVF